MKNTKKLLINLFKRKTDNTAYYFGGLMKVNKSFKSNVCTLLALMMIVSSAYANPSAKAAEAGNKHKSGFAAVVEVVTGFVGLFLVSACGKSDSASSSTVALSGVAQMGSMINGEVKACLVSDMADNDVCDAPIKTGETDINGAYVLDTPPQTEPVIIEVSGKADGSTYFVNEADGTKVTVADTETLEVIVPDPSVAGEYPATPYTKTAYQMVKNQLGTDFKSVTPENMATYSENSYKQTAEAFGITDYKVLKQLPSNPADPNATQNAAAFAMGQYSKFLGQNGITAANAMVAVNHIAVGFKDGTLASGDMPAAYAGLATAFDNSTTGFQAAAGAYAADTAHCPKGLGTVYTANVATFGPPDKSPQNYVGAAYDYNKSKDAAAKDGKTFVDPCAPATLNAAACPKPEYIAAGNYQPGTYDTFKNTNNPTVTYGVPTGVNGYTGSGEGTVTFTPPPSEAAYKAGTYTPPTGGTTFVPLTANCVVSGGSGTITITPATAGLAYTYTVKKAVMGSGMTNVLGATAGTSSTIVVTTATSGQYEVGINITAPTSAVQMFVTNCYKSM